MLWFYFAGVVLLLGGELNAEIEKAARELQSHRDEAVPAVERQEGSSA